jgi:hypothetical protein
VLVDEPSKLGRHDRERVFDAFVEDEVTVEVEGEPLCGCGDPRIEPARVVGGEQRVAGGGEHHHRAVDAAVGMPDRSAVNRLAMNRSG